LEILKTILPAPTSDNIRFYLGRQSGLEAEP
jgi:hypothetical protein